MKIMSFDVSIEPGWEGSISPYNLVANHRGGGHTTYRCQTLDEVKSQIGHFLDQDAPQMLEKYRQIPYEFRDQVK